HPQVLRQLVIEWPPGEEACQILRALPVFFDGRGELVEITPSTRTVGGFDPGGAEGLPLVLLPVDEADAVYAARLRALAPPLTARDAVELVLRGPGPARRGGFVLKALEQVQDWDPALREILRETRWLLAT